MFVPPQLPQNRVRRSGFGLCSTYPLVQVDGVLARHHVGDGRAGLLAGVDVGHLCRGVRKIEKGIKFPD